MELNIINNKSNCTRKKHLVTEAKADPAIMPDCLNSLDDSTIRTTTKL